MERNMKLCNPINNEVWHAMQIEHIVSLGEASTLNHNFPLYPPSHEPSSTLRYHAGKFRRMLDGRPRQIPQEDLRSLFHQHARLIPIENWFKPAPDYLHSNIVGDVSKGLVDLVNYEYIGTHRINVEAGRHMTSISITNVPLVYQEEILPYIQQLAEEAFSNCIGTKLHEGGEWGDKKSFGILGRGGLTSDTIGLSADARELLANFINKCESYLKSNKDTEEFMQKIASCNNSLAQHVDKEQQHEKDDESKGWRAKYHPAMRLMHLSKNCYEPMSRSESATSPTIGIWCEKRPYHAKHAYLIFPNVTRDTAKPVVVKLRHGTVVCWDSAKIWSSTSIPVLSGDNELYGVTFTST